MSVCCPERHAHRPDCKLAPTGLAADLDQLRALEVGDKLYVGGQRQGFTVRARDERYLICTKPFNPRRSCLYFIADLERGIRGTDNMVLGTGYEDQDSIDENLALLQAGEIEVSHRNHVQLKVDRVVKAATA